MAGDFTSVAFPVSRPIERVTSAASPVGTLVVIGSLMVAVMLAGAITVGAAVLGTPRLQPVAALGLVAAIAAVYRWSLRPAARALDVHREGLERAISAG